MTSDANRTPLAAFTRFTDPVVMRSLWQEHGPTVFNESLTVDACTALYTYYKTYLRPASREKSTLSVCYQLMVTNAQHETTTRLLFCLISLKERSQEVPPETLEASSSSSPADVAHIPALDAIVWRFPSDPRLPQLPELVDPQRVIQHLPYASLSVTDPSTVSRIAVDIVHYRPGERCTLRYDLTVLHNGQPEHYVLFAKTFAHALGEESAHRMEYLWSVSRALPFRTAPPLGYNATLSTVWQQGVEGRPLASVLQSADAETVLVAIGHSVAALHRSHCPARGIVTAEERLRDARKKTRKLQQAFPEFTAPVQALLRQIETDYDRMPTGSTCVLHGDLHIGQFLVADRVPVLFDFDEFTNGDPAQDLANFIVDLYVTDANHSHAAKQAAVFLAAYQDVAQEGLWLSRVAWHIRVQLLNKAYRFYVQVVPQTREKIEQVFTLAKLPMAHLVPIEEPVCPQDRPQHHSGD